MKKKKKPKKIAIRGYGEELASGATVWAGYHAKDKNDDSYHAYPVDTCRR